MQQAVSFLDETIRRLQNPTELCVTSSGAIIDSKFIDFDIDKISAFINSKLSDITLKYDCRILLVAERSSHVWGSSHPRSDNGMYIQRSLDLLLIPMVD